MIIAMASVMLTNGGAHAQDATIDTAPDGAQSPAGDPAAGRKVFSRCRGCHTLTGRHDMENGPDLRDFIGRTAGTSAGYDRYSKALKESGIVWSEQTITAWISDPDTFLPGNKMALAPVRSAKDRADLVAFLLEATSAK